MKIKFKFKNADKIFPAEYTKLKMPLGVYKLVEEKGKFMSLDEIKRIQEFERKWNRQLRANTSSFEYYAKKNKNLVELIPFDDEQ